MEEVSNKTVSTLAIEAEWEEIQAAQQDRALFRPLYQRYYEPIFRFVYNRMANEELTADITAQVFIKALQKLSTYEFKGVPFSAWLYRIASSEVALYYRKEKKNRVVSLDGIHSIGLIDEAVGDETESYTQMLDKLVEVLDDLPIADIELIEMRFFEERPFKEIAEILNTSEANAKMKTYRLLERLKKKLTGKKK